MKDKDKQQQEEQDYDEIDREHYVEGAGDA